MKTLSPTRACLASSFVLAFVWAGCGGSENGGSPTVDSGIDSTPGDTSLVDGSTDGRADGDTKSDVKDSKPVDTADANVLNLGTKVTDGTVYINGVTTDDQIVFSDSSGAPLQVVALAGGTATTIDAATQAGFVVGKVAFSLNTADTTAKTATLLAWTAASGVHTIGSGISYAAPIAAARDGSSVLYCDTSTAVTGGTEVTVKYAKVDGTGVKTLLPALFIATDGSCAPQVLSSSTGYVIQHCDVPVTGGDAGVDVGIDAGSTSLAQLDAVDADGTLRSLATNVSPSFTIHLDKSGANVVYATGSGDLDVVPFTGGAPTLIESGGVQTALLAATASDVIYTTGASAMKRSPVATPAPVSVLGSGSALLIAATPNLGAALFVDTTSDFQDATASGVGYSVFALFFVDTTATPPTTGTLSATPDATIFGDAFTADGKFAMTQTGTSGSSPTFDLTIAEIATGKKTALTTDAFEELAYGTASKIVYNDAWDGSGGVGPSGSADVSTVDLGASGATPTKIAVGAESDIFLDSTRTKVIYSSAANPGSEGIYVYTLP